jgi:Fe-S cluster assembly ATPase SufC
MTTPILEIRNLHARIEEREILKGVNLTIPAGQVHAIMGRNGSGKSTLSYVLAGKEDYEVTEGEVLLNGREHPGDGAVRTRRPACSSPSSTRSKSPALPP